jgi:hydrogenase maturation protein HypF
VDSRTLPAQEQDDVQGCTVVVEGVVQGVGYRPFVHSLAERHRLRGSVRNGPGAVLIDVQGTAASIDAFLTDLAREAPPAGRAERLSTIPWTGLRYERPGFSIVASDVDGDRAPFPAPDRAPCAACLAELADPADRRHRYAFLNCTACGPRFTIVRALPYDRVRTTMADFAMCPACRAEYDDPGDRRFHAEPIACPECGPRLRLLGGDGSPLAVGDVVGEAAAGLRGGAIVAVKGVGGYHLACDATNRAAVAELRRRKARDAKPFAVMVSSLDAARRICAVSDTEAETLASPARPIVLLAAREPTPIAGEVAPGLARLGLLLPPTPLHALLLAAAGAPLVMTSGNRADEPIACDDDDAVARLRGVADLFLAHDRAIHARCDDSVAVAARGRPLLLRRSRGYVPLALALPVEAARPVLAVGGELKSTVALVRGRHAFLSQHLGDLGDARAYRAFTAAIEHLERLLAIVPAVVAHDAHPGYRSTAYAERRDGLLRIAVQHHHAHVASCLADNATGGRVIGVAWDGTGHGPDGHVWGGEFLVADLAGFERAGHLEEVPLPGGEAAVREPWRVAAAFLHAAYGASMDRLDLAFLRRIDAPAWRVLVRAAERGLNAPLTSSAGRLFDAVAALLGLRHRVAFEGQAAMELEALAEPAAAQTYRVAIEHVDGRAVVRTTDVIRGVVHDLLAEVPAPRIAARFHATLAGVIVTTAAAIRARTGLGRVALSGGVFQNVWLTHAAVAGLEARGFEVLTHSRVPPNDGGLALGQAAVAARLSAPAGV